MPSQTDQLRLALRLIQEHMTPGTRRGYVERRIVWEIAELESNLTRPCTTCGQMFTLSPEAAESFAKRGQPFPTRCRDCALARRSQGT